MNQKGFVNIAIIVILVVVIAGTVGYLTLVNKSPQSTLINPTPTQKPSIPLVERISPAEALVGAKVSVIGSGFTSNKNSLQFGTGFAYINNLISSDGRTIMFTLPESFDTCNSDGSVCAELLSRPIPGQMYEVAVINANGESNRVSFTVAREKGTPTQTPTPNGGTGSIKSSTGTVQPEDPNKTGLAPYPDLSLTLLPTEPVSIEFVVEHRSALNSKTITVRGFVVATLLGEKACPPDRGMCTQPSIFLADTTSESRNKLYDLMMLVNEAEQESNYPIGKTVMVQVSIDGSRVAVVAGKTY